MRTSDAKGKGIVDAVVVGGGPAGCAAARVLGTAGFEVILLERGGIGRDKACGDMFMPSAVRALKRLGLDEQRLRDVGGVQCPAVEMLGSSGPLWCVTYPDEPIWILPRRLIDQALRDALPHPIRVAYRMTARALEPANGGWYVRVHGDKSEELDWVLARVVVVASGAGSMLPRVLGLDSRALLGVAISAYMLSDAIAAPAFQFIQSYRPGYRWIFPASADIVNIGVCALVPSKGSTLKALGQRFLEERNLNAEVQWRSGAGALWSGRTGRWHHPRGLLACGDAAGLVDPLTGEGLTSALLSGEEAGKAAAFFLREAPNARALEKYSQWVKNYFTAAYAPSAIRSAWRQLCGCP